MNSSSGLNYPAIGRAVFTGHIKQQPQDFKVVEQLGFELSGKGEHLFLSIQKTGLTTPQMIDRIAKQLEVSSRQVGYSGLKDKQAVTQQWISVQLPGCREIPHIDQTDDLQLLSAGWHDKKLRIGSHRRNHFEITVRDVTATAEYLAARQQSVSVSGFANYFGQQRFGTTQDNVSQALRALNNRHKRKRLSRHKKSLYLSALRSECFNQILSQRIGQGIWELPLEGDAFILSGSQSVFSEPLDETLIERYRQFDLHSAVSLFGVGETRLSAAAQALEEKVLDECDDIAQTLLASKVKRAFRANRAVAHNLKMVFNQDDAILHINVDLEKGVYFTTLLNHFLDISAS